jgi:hypothetical protein
MDLKLKLGHNYSWNFSVSDFHPFNENTNVTLQLEVIPSSNLYEHEAVIESLTNAEQKGYLSLKKLQGHILENGFLHPVLAHYLHSSNKWVLADGTHRLKAMNELKSKCIVGLKLLKENYQRDCWIKALSSLNQSDCRQILDNLQKKYNNLSIREIHSQDKNIPYNHVYNPNLLAYINTPNLAYEILDKNPGDRLIHLQLIKELDSIFDNEDKDYKTKSELSLETDSFLLLPPPIDETNDMSYLVDNKELRRIKGSRTVLDVRPVYFGIPFEILQRSESEILNYLAERIDDNLNRKAIGTIYPKKSFTTSLDPSWYYHTLLIGDKRLFFKEARTEGERKNLENFFTPVNE